MQKETHLSCNTVTQKKIRKLHLEQGSKGSKPVEHCETDLPRLHPLRIVWMGFWSMAPWKWLLLSPWCLCLSPLLCKKKKARRARNRAQGWSTWGGGDDAGGEEADNKCSEPRDHFPSNLFSVKPEDKQAFLGFAET